MVRLRWWHVVDDLGQLLFWVAWLSFCVLLAWCAAHMPAVCDMIDLGVTWKD